MFTYGILPVDPRTGAKTGEELSCVPDHINQDQSIYVDLGAIEPDRFLGVGFWPVTAIDNSSLLPGMVESLPHTHTTDMATKTATRIVVAREMNATELLAAKNAKIASLYGSCAKAVTSGFVSSALGAPHTYPMTELDQTNLLGRVAQSQLAISITGWTTSFWCADVDGVWEKRTHSASQMIAVGQDAAAWAQTCSDKLTGTDGVSGLIGAVNASTDGTAVASIVW